MTIVDNLSAYSADKAANKGDSVSTDPIQHKNNLFHSLHFFCLVCESVTAYQGLPRRQLNAPAYRCPQRVHQVETRGAY